MTMTASMNILIKTGFTFSFFFCKIFRNMPSRGIFQSKQELEKPMRRAKT